MRMASLLLLVVAGPAVCLAAEPKEPLQFTDLVAVQQQLRDLDQFLDNEYIYKDKLDEFAKKLGELDGRLISLSLRVERVSSGRVRVMLPKVTAEGETARRYGRGSMMPGIVLVPEGAEEADLAKERSLDLHNSHETRVTAWKALPGNVESLLPFGALVGRAAFDLPIDEVVGLDLAKVLRADDRLLVRGTVRPLIVTQGGQGRCVAFLIRDPKVERAKAADDPEEDEDAR
jgi:hypothetical protein